MSNRLLPSNSTKLEILAAEALDKFSRVPIPISQLYNPSTCPVELLPYLAWAWSVDRWDPSWSESQKRNVIKNAYAVHKRKGTIGSLRRVVEPLGYLIKVTEWWNYSGVPGTFKIDIGVLDTGITDEMYEELERLISDAKPVSRHLIGLSIKAEVAGVAYIGAAAMSGVTTTVYPYQAEDQTISTPLYMAASAIIRDAVSIYPQ